MIIFLALDDLSPAVAKSIAATLTDTVSGQQQRSIGGLHRIVQAQNRLNNLHELELRATFMISLALCAVRNTRYKQLLNEPFCLSKQFEMHALFAQ